MDIILPIIGAVIILVLAGLFLVSGIFEPIKYLEPWDKKYWRKFDDPRIQLAAHGLLAANAHNMQPWKIRLDKNDPRVFYLYADSDRFTHEVDPLARQLMVTQGTFLEYVKIAGKELGYPVAVDLFPEGELNEGDLVESMRAKPAAKITLSQSSPQDESLYDEMYLPDTNRLAYLGESLTAEQVSRLIAVQEDDSIMLRVFRDRENLDKIRQFALMGATIEASTARVMEETEHIFFANERQKNTNRYGFSVEGQGTSGVMQHLLQSLVTLFPAANTGKAGSDRFVASIRMEVNNTPAYVMILSRDNSRSSQVKSGMIYSRVLLSAHRLGLVMQPVSQALEEYPEMTEPYHLIHRHYASEGGTIQMLVRIGKPKKEVPRSMRRDVLDLIERA